ncbi:hypothetical protein CDV31_005096 [Fusarium ambrosium]|uniref:Uncharacterized protein n=1 Tax=Fusarium ambrosium TaxID=131363 RepID=A0A428ULS7_9HYPO|nr:hypothetical protein CDV31_005096 [Fusarium ambrosium]
MGDRVQVRYTFTGIEEWDECREQLREIIQNDTGEEAWIETRSLPPIGMPPPLTAEAVQKLKGLAGVNVQDLSEE